MNKEQEKDQQEKKQFEEPKIIATYEKEELEEAIRPHLFSPSYGGGSIL